jgi:hypothetical protein
MRKFLLAIITISLVSCGVQTKYVTPENITTYTPELNETNNSEIGITLVSKETGYKYNAIKISKGRKAKPGYIVKEIKEGDVFIHDIYTSKYNLYSNPADISYGIAIPKLGGQAIIYSNNGMGINFIKIKEGIEFKETFAPVPKKEYFKQEFIYNGRVGNALKFIYREYIDDLARPAFTQDLQYDLSESKTIGFRGLRIEVITATNTNIEYKVISQFSK